jgi:ATP-binding cassette subfamily E protein 1
MASRKKTSDNKDEDKLTRIAIVSMDKCKPKRCRQECKKWCPVVRGGGLCIEADPTSKTASISEELCIGCGICVKKCPFDAIQIINLPRNLEKYTTHRYGPNSFKLHRLPMPRPGQCLGLVGSNGTGKSTALKILASKLKPNLGQYSNPPDWEEILKYFRGSELQGYFQRILEDRLKALIKPQYVDIIPKTVKGIDKDLLKQKDERDVMAHYVDDLQLQSILDRDVAALSGGELQRFTIAISCVQKADVYMYDEPSSYLDVKQRLKAAKTIRNMIKSDNYIICVEHDLSVLDYLSDFICCLYGVPGGYGVVTMPFGVREGINIFLDGFVPTENLRFRDESLNFKITDAELEEIQNRAYQYKYPGMVKTMGGQFKLTVEPGEFTDSEIVVLLGENGTGKTTFIRLLAGIIKPDDEKISIPELMISVKPQTISPKFQGTVKALLQTKIRDAILHPQFSTDVLKPLHLEEIMDQEIQNISGGELQRVAIVLALGKPADVYLLDEPSAFLDSEQRLAASKVIKRFILHAKKTAFVVEHDFIMATYLADRVIVYEGEPSVSAKANSPQSLLNGMNKFLSQLEITFRRDPENFRPRINKGDSVKDKEQKMNGNYFYMDQGDAKPDAKKKAEAAAAAAAAAAASGGGDEKKKEKKEKKKKNEE